MDVPDAVITIKPEDLHPRDDPDAAPPRKPKEIDESDRELLAVGIGCAKVLNSISSSPKIKEELRKHGVMFLIARFLKSEITELVVPIMGAVQQCADMVRLQFCSRACIHRHDLPFAFRKFSDSRSRGWRSSMTSCGTCRTKTPSSKRTAR